MINPNSWLCLQTNAGQEQKLVTALIQLSIPAYTPRFQRQITRFFTPVVTEFALFKTYLFASPEEYLDRQSAVRLLPTRMKSYRVGEIPLAFVEEIRAREGKDGYIALTGAESKAVKQRYKRGDRLIYSGLSDFEAIFDSYTSDESRVIILATMFNQQQRIPVDSHRIAFA